MVANRTWLNGAATSHFDPSETLRLRFVSGSISLPS
jgi:hypothetical protein